MKPICITGNTDYTVTQRIGEFPGFTVYACNAGDGQELMLKISAGISDNGLLDREAFLLREIEEEISKVNADFKSKNSTDDGLGYKRCFPQLVDSFVSAEQGGRRVNVVSVYGADRISDLVPLEQFRTREKKRIDPMSSAWIMGRLLKIFTLTHPLGISIGQVTGGNILINPKAHHVVFFDWSLARYLGKPRIKKVAQEEISQAATAVVLALGGNPITGELPVSEQLTDDRYAHFLKVCMTKKKNDPFKAGKEFYGILESMWGKSFHPFTTYPI